MAHTKNIYCPNEHPTARSIVRLWRRTSLPAIAVIVLAGCGAGSGKVTTSSTSSTVVAPIAAPSSTKTVTSTTTQTEIVKPIETVAPIPTAMETFRAMAPEQGLKITPLFSTPAGDNEVRIKRIEDAVQNMHNDFDTVMPTIVRMAAMEKDMRDLIGKLHTLTGEPNPIQEAPNHDSDTLDGNPMEIAPSMEPPIGNPEAWDDIDKIGEAIPHKTVKTITKTVVTTTVPPVAATSGSSDNPSSKGDIIAVRIGDHPDMTRVVLEMSVKTSLTPNFQNDGKQLVIDLPALNWTPAVQRTFKNGSLISGYTYADGKLTLDLRHPTKIKAQQSLPPEGENGFRYVLDLSAAS